MLLLCILMGMLTLLSWRANSINIQLTINLLVLPAVVQLSGVLAALLHCGVAGARSQCSAYS